MPTKKQIANLTERLDAMRYTVFDCAPGQVPNPVDTQDEEQVLQRGHRDFAPNSTGWTTWDRLSTNERRVMLGLRIDWRGFTDQQQQRIIQRVLESDEPEKWMDGFARSLWDQGVKALKAQDKGRNRHSRLRERKDQ
jgi:exonuclease III